MMKSGLGICILVMENYCMSSLEIHDGELVIFWKLGCFLLELLVVEI